MPPLFFILVLIVITVAVYAAGASARRRKMLAAWARSRGLSFDPSKDRSMDGRFSAFDCLRRGHSRYAYNVMRGTCAKLDVTAFDYHYATGSGKNRSDYHFSAVVAAAPLPLKDLYIRREGIFDKVTEFFGLDDIDFESAEFSRRFYVKAPDRKWAYDVIHQRAMEFLLRSPRCSIQFAERQVIAWRDTARKPQDFAATADVLAGLLDLLPDYLVQQQRLQPPRLPETS